MKKIKKYINMSNLEMVGGTDTRFSETYPTRDGIVTGRLTARQSISRRGSTDSQERFH